MSHRIHFDLYNGPKVLKDPGDGNTIRVVDDLQICEMVSDTAVESRTLAVPTKPGIRLVLRMLTDGGGDIIVYSANGFNKAENKYIAFSDEGDFLSLISVSTDTDYRWEILEGNVGVTVAA